MFFLVLLNPLTSFKPLFSIFLLLEYDKYGYFSTQMEIFLVCKTVQGLDQYTCLGKTLGKAWIASILLIITD